MGRRDKEELCFIGYIMDEEKFKKDFLHYLDYSFPDKCVTVMTSFGYITADLYFKSFLIGYVELYLNGRHVAQIQLKRIRGITYGYKIEEDNMDKVCDLCGKDEGKFITITVCQECIQKNEIFEAINDVIEWDDIKEVKYEKGNTKRNRKV